MSEQTVATDKSRISKINLGRVYNLGNYENMRVEVTVDISPNDDPAKIFRSVENILGDLRATGPESYYLRRAKAALENGDPSKYSESELEGFSQTLAQHEAAMKRRETARDALSTLNYTSEHRDAKDSWEDDE